MSLSSRFPNAGVLLALFAGFTACGDINVDNGDVVIGTEISADTTVIGHACIVDADCKTGIACWVGSCDAVSLTCVATVSPDQCLIDGLCFNRGQSQAGDTCKECNPDLNETEFVKKVCPNDGSCNSVTGQCEGSCQPTGDETCDGLDNDCNGETDETFKTDGEYLSDAHCGACDASCAITNGTATCELSGADPACAVVSCDEGYVETAAGICASPCTDGSVPAPDICGDGLDNDCDGTADTDCGVVGFQVMQTNARVVGTTDTGDVIDAVFSALPIGAPAPADAPYRVQLGITPHFQASP